MNEPKHAPGYKPNPHYSQEDWDEVSDNPPWTDEELERGVFARGVRRTRERLKMTQDAFAAALGLPLATLRNWEQGRVSPDPAARSLMRLVAADPKRAVDVLAA